MRIFTLVMAAVLNATAAIAHPSVVPHEHPHATSVLPDALALVLAALVIGIGFAAWRQLGKE